MKENKIDDYINAHPRQFVIILFLGCCFILQIPATLLGALIYFVLRKYKVPHWLVLVLGLMLLIIITYFENGELSKQALIHFVKIGYQSHWLFWRNLWIGNYQLAGSIFFEYHFSYILSLPLLIGGSLGILDLIPNPAHAERINALQQGKLLNERQQLSDKAIASALEKINDKNCDGILLGVSKFSGLPIIIPDKYVNQVALVLGTTGAGKTMTIRRFYHQAIRRGYPLIIIDGKPDAANIQWVINLAKQYNRKFYGFNCGNYCHYNPLKEGGHTELKDKIISLKDEWENDYYRSIAEDYLQTTFEVLLKNAEPIDLKKVVECLNYDDLQTLVRRLKDDEVSKRVDSLEHYKRDDITGLQAHLNILINSELGRYFTPNEQTFTLNQVINDGGIVYFALPALRFPSFSKVLGKLVINDLKAVVDRLNDQDKKIFTVFDEFSVFAGEQVLNLVNMGRSKGVHAIFGTQGLADLEKVDKTFKSQILNCANTLICHRLNDQESAEAIASWVGTKDMFTLTAKVNLKKNDASLGSVRVNKEFIIHPDEIKQGLQTGEVFYVTKVGKFKWDKVLVKLC